MYYMSIDNIKDHILSQVTIADPESSPMVQARIESVTLTPGATSVVYVYVDDYDIALTVPAYVTVVKADVGSSVGAFANATVRNISEEYYPYLRTDIAKEGNRFKARRDADEAERKRLEEIKAKARAKANFPIPSDTGPMHPARWAGG